jgi:hypothetical protein
MDRDGNLTGFFRFTDEAGSRLGQDYAASKPQGAFGLTPVAAAFFQACAARACEFSGAAREKPHA